MPVEKLKSFLDENQIKYTVIAHSPAYTAQEIAQSAHIPGKELAKTVIVKVDGKLVMVVLPASKYVFIDALRKSAGANNVELAAEQDFKHAFPDCETGAMPPFGNLYDMDVYVDRQLSEDNEIAFNAGTHTELIRLAYADFARLVKPELISM